MLFEVLKDGEGLMCTDYPSCIYDEATLNSMKSGGMTFKINGKAATIKQALAIREEPPVLDDVDDNNDGDNEELANASTSKVKSKAASKSTTKATSTTKSKSATSTKSTSKTTKETTKAKSKTAAKTKEEVGVTEKPKSRTRNTKKTSSSN